jgi:hypothetical protein
MHPFYNSQLYIPNSRIIIHTTILCSWKQQNQAYQLQHTCWGSNAIQVNTCYLLKQSSNIHKLDFRLAWFLQVMKPWFLLTIFAQESRFGWSNMLFLTIFQMLWCSFECFDFCLSHEFSGGFSWPVFIKRDSWMKNLLKTQWEKLRGNPRDFVLQSIFSTAFQYFSRFILHEWLWLVLQIISFVAHLSIFYWKSPKLYTVACVHIKFYQLCHRSSLTFSVTTTPVRWTKRYLGGWWGLLIVIDPCWDLSCFLPFASGMIDCN